MAKKKKLSKKEIEEDKLVETFFKAKEFYEDNQTPILIGVAVVAAIVLSVIWYSNKMVQDNQLANTEISRVISFYNDGNYQVAISGQEGTPNIGFEKIVSEYGSTDQGELAKIYLGNSYFFLGKIDEAKKAYDSYSGSNEEFKAAAYSGLAACEDYNGNFENAAEFYQKSANVSDANPNNAENLLNAGKCYLKLGDKKSAKKLFDSIKKDYKNSNVIRELPKYLAQL